MFATIPRVVKMVARFDFSTIWAVQGSSSGAVQVTEQEFQKKGGEVHEDWKDPVAFWWDRLQ